LKAGFLFFLCVFPTWLWSQTSSIEKQRLSIRRQVKATGPAGAFFTTPWMDAPVVTNGAVAAPGDCDALPEESLRTLVLGATQREGVSPKLVQALIKRESGGKPCAVSAKGAQGLMQLMPATQLDLGVRDPFDAGDNVAAGVRYLKQMLDRYDGNTALALAAYNAGPQRVTPGGKIPDIPETQTYVMSILGDLNEDSEPGSATSVK
jgi:soluble lytic murein transglycosylase-like protein